MIVKPKKQLLISQTGVLGKHIHPFYLLRQLNMDLVLTPVKNAKTLMKLELDVGPHFTIDEGLKIMKILYKDYIISDISELEFNETK